MDSLEALTRMTSVKTEEANSNSCHAGGSVAVWTFLPSCQTDFTAQAITSMKFCQCLARVTIMRDQNQQVFVSSLPLKGGRCVCVQGCKCAGMRCHKNYYFCCWSDSELEYVCTDVCYGGFKKERKVINVELSVIESCRGLCGTFIYRPLLFRSGKDSEHKHAFYSFISSVKCCCSPAAEFTCVGNRWESIVLSSRIDYFTVRLIPFSDVWIKI